MNIRIGELAKKAGVSVKAIRGYEKYGLIKHTDFTSGGIKLYDENDVSTIFVILVFAEAGYSRSEIKKQFKKVNRKGQLKVFQEVYARLQKKKERIEKNMNFIDSIIKSLDAHQKIMDDDPGVYSDLMTAISKNGGAKETLQQILDKVKPLNDEESDNVNFILPVFIRLERILYGVEEDPTNEKVQNMIKDALKAAIRLDYENEEDANEELADYDKMTHEQIIDKYSSYIRVIYDLCVDSENEDEVSNLFKHHSRERVEFLLRAWIYFFTGDVV